MELKDAITIMILFATFVVALLTYIGNKLQEKVKTHPMVTRPEVGFVYST